MPVKPGVGVKLMVPWLAPAAVLAVNVPPTCVPTTATVALLMVPLPSASVALVSTGMLFRGVLLGVVPPFTFTTTGAVLPIVIV